MAGAGVPELEEGTAGLGPLSGRVLLRCGWCCGKRECKEATSVNPNCSLDSTAAPRIQYHCQVCCKEVRPGGCRPEQEANRNSQGAGEEGPPFPTYHPQRLTAQGRQLAKPGHLHRPSPDIAEGMQKAEKTGNGTWQHNE